MTNLEVLEKTKIDMETRNFDEKTIKSYLSKIAVFQEHYKKPADQMGENEIQGYLHYLLTVMKYQPSSVNIYNSALRFVYSITLDVNLNLKKLPRAKPVRKLPQIFTADEIQLIIQNAKNPAHKAMIMLAYGSGLRLSEITQLKVSDIDSKQMRIFIRQGKGGRDRFAILPQATLGMLREYWRVYRPNDWLFEAPRASGHYLGRTLNKALKSALHKAGISKKGSIHTLRHCFACHLLEEGNSLFAIKKLMGHARINSTAWYAQLTDAQMVKLVSPIDHLPQTQYHASEKAVIEHA